MPNCGLYIEYLPDIFPWDSGPVVGSRSENYTPRVACLRKSFHCEDGAMASFRIWKWPHGAFPR